MKPFNLNDALVGAPVILRNGTKAYVLGLVPDGIKTHYPLRGIVVGLNPAGELAVGKAARWTLSGKNYLHTSPHPTDIVGLWEEEEELTKYRDNIDEVWEEEEELTKYREINGHKFPEPCSEPLDDGQSYFTIDLEAGAEVTQSIWRDAAYDNRLLNRGLIHTTKEAAQAHSDAINSLFRGEPCSD